MDAGVDIDGAASEWTREEVGAKLDQIFSGTIPRTEEDRAMVTFVDGYLEKNKKLDAPQSRRYFVDKREESRWIVRVVDVEMARRYGRVRGLLVHVQRDSRGGWNVVEVMPSM